jgi:uncharacterized protein
VLVTTEEVLTEFLAAVSSHGDHTRRLACRLVREILGDPRIQVAAQSHESFLAGLALYERRPDKEYSLTDCISMNVMRHRGIQDVLTNDRHFAQEGFKRLLDRSIGASKVGKRPFRRLWEGVNDPPPNLTRLRLAAALYSWAQPGGRNGFDGI